jgi:hypothetical protein
LRTPAFVVLLCGYGVAFSQHPPNIIVIQADDLGYGDVGAFRALYQGGDNKSSAGENLAPDWCEK